MHGRLRPLPCILSENLYKNRLLNCLFFVIGFQFSTTTESKILDLELRNLRLSPHYHLDRLATNSDNVDSLAQLAHLATATHKCVDLAAIDAVHIDALAIKALDTQAIGHSRPRR